MSGRMEVPAESPLVTLRQVRDMLETLKSRKVPSSGGFPDDIFYEFDRESNDDLICNICYMVLRKTRECVNGHRFCNSCISTWLEKGGGNASNCPVCRADTEYLRSRSVDVRISHLLVMCRCEGCKWGGDVGGWKRHKKLKHSKNTPVVEKTNTLPSLHGKQSWSTHANGRSQITASLPVIMPTFHPLRSYRTNGNSAPSVTRLPDLYGNGTATERAIPHIVGSLASSNNTTDATNTLRNTSDTDYTTTDNTANVASTPDSLNTYDVTSSTSYQTDFTTPEISTNSLPLSPRNLESPISSDWSNMGYRLSPRITRSLPTQQRTSPLLDFAPLLLETESRSDASDNDDTNGTDEESTTTTATGSPESRLLSIYHMRSSMRDIRRGLDSLVNGMDSQLNSARRVADEMNSQIQRMRRHSAVGMGHLMRRLESVVDQLADFVTQDNDDDIF